MRWTKHGRMKKLFILVGSQNRSGNRTNIVGSSHCHLSRHLGRHPRISLHAPTVFILLDVADRRLKNAVDVWTCVCVCVCVWRSKLTVLLGLNGTQLHYGTQGGNYKTWKRRWFVVRGYQMLYFKDASVSAIRVFLSIFGCQKCVSQCWSFIMGDAMQALDVLTRHCVVTAGHSTTGCDFIGVPHG
jgi:hypothetical protein